MRKILFRGKDPETGKWYEGFYMALSDTTYCFEKDYAAHPDNTKHYIVFDEMTDWGLPNRHLRADVDPTTVGQYTGLNDKNGKRIFEGDIIELFAQGESEHPDFGYIEYDEQSFAWRVCWQKYDPDWLEGMQSQYITVIGNIFDNKDLLS